MPEMKGAIADNINNRTNKQSNKLSSPAKNNQEINHICNEQTWALQSQATMIHQ